MTWQGLWLQLHTFLGDINSQLKQKRFCNPLQFFTKDLLVYILIFSCICFFFH